MESNENRRPKEHTILPTIFYILATLLFVLGVISGYYAGVEQYPPMYTISFKLQVVLAIWIVTILGTALLFGFGKIIDLLAKIANKE